MHEGRSSLFKQRGCELQSKHGAKLHPAGEKLHRADTPHMILRWSVLGPDPGMNRCPALNPKTTITTQKCTSSPCDVSEPHGSRSDLTQTNG